MNGSNDAMHKGTAGKSEPGAVPPTVDGGSFPVKPVNSSTRLIAEIKECVHGIPTSNVSNLFSCTFCLLGKQRKAI